jgi:CIC family chloride channel protein
MGDRRQEPAGPLTERRVADRRGAPGEAGERVRRSPAAFLARRRAALQAWAERLEWDEGAVLMALGALIGVAAGLAVAGFYGLIDVAYSVFVAWPERHLGVMPRLALAPLLTAVGVWAAWLVVRRAHVPDGQTVPDVQLAVAKRSGAIAMRPVGVRTLASAITLGSGASAGSEGPVAVLGAALGSALGRTLGFQPRNVKILVGCGAAAGIAGAFNAPFAGAFFALEEVLGSFSVGAFSPVVIASVVGALTVRPFLGSHPAFRIPPAGDVHPVRSALLYPLLGFACGVAGAAFSRLNLAMPGLVRRAPGPAWLKAVIGGALVGGIVVLSFGFLDGNGHLAIPGAVFGGLAWYFLIGLALAKMLATALTLGSGGSGGVFTPTLFIGAALGGGMGRLMNDLLPGGTVHPHAWALVGMAGLVAAATRAPLTAIFMVFEMTDDYSYIVPLMIVSVVAYTTAKRFAPHGLYDGWLVAQGQHLAHGADRALMERLHVRDAVDRRVETVGPGASLSELATVVARTRQSVIPVVEEDGAISGIVTHHGLRDALLEGDDVAGLLVAADLAEPVQPLAAAQSLRSAMAAMNARAIDALPVTADGDARCIGLLSRADVLAAYERELEHQV